MGNCMILDLESFKNCLPLPIGNLTVTSKDFTGKTKVLDSSFSFFFECSQTI
jgi:hypothetical protein